MLYNVINKAVCVCDNFKHRYDSKARTLVANVSTPKHPFYLSMMLQTCVNIKESARCLN